MEKVTIEDIAEFRSGNSTPVERATLTRKRMQAILDARQFPDVQDLYELLKEARQQLPLAAACWNEDENREIADTNAKRVLGLIAKIDEAMRRT